MRRVLAGLAPIVSAALLTSTSPAAQPQAPCALEALKLPAVTEPIAFTPEQEMQLGEVVAEHVNRSLDVIEGPLNEHLQRIGDRIAAELPATGLTFTFRLVDQPFWSAFAMPGGRIYVTRKLVAFVRSEDELAGVMAHEVGHLLARHTAIDLTADFKRSIGVTSFGDRADIEEKYQQLVDARRRLRHNARREHRQQLEADLVAMIAVARAGYAPTAYVELWDRYTETEGRTGNFFSDLFGATRPESRRLREMLRTMRAIPAECRTATTGDAGFLSWQRQVIEYDGPASTASAAQPAQLLKLTPSLRPDISHIEFSRDGRWVVAQDGAGVSVLSAEPLEMRFRIPIDGARPAQFTPDSRQVLVHTPSQRIERWDLDSRQRVDVLEMAGKQRCLASRLSPDGRLLGCVDVGFDVLVVDVATEEVLFRKIHAYRIDYRALLYAWRNPNAKVTFDVFHLEFSPDGRYFIVGGPAGEVIVDLETRREGKLSETMRRAFRGAFDFVGNDRVVTVNGAEGRKSTIVSYPDGKPIGQVSLTGRVSAATRGDLVVVRPMGPWPAALVDLAANRPILASRTPALDVFERRYISERPSGDLALYELHVSEPEAVTTLPHTALGPLDVFDVTSDLKYLAVSGRDRGAVWDLATGERLLFVRAFTGAFVGPDDMLYADFPARQDMNEGKLVETPRQLVRMNLAGTNAKEISKLEGDATIIGRHITSLQQAPDDSRTLGFEVRDVMSNAVVWTERFDNDQLSRIVVDRMSGRVAIVWRARADRVKLAVKDDPALRERSLQADKSDAFVELIDPSTKKRVAQLFVSPGDVRHVTSAGDYVAVADSENQVTVFSIGSGKALGSVFGSRAVISEAAGLLAVENDHRAVDVYELRTLERLARLAVGSPVRLARFGPEGKRLMVLTARQEVQFFDTAALRAASGTSSR